VAVGRAPGKKESQLRQVGRAAARGLKMGETFSMVQQYMGTVTAAVLTVSTTGKYLK